MFFIRKKNTLLQINPQRLLYPQLLNEGIGVELKSGFLHKKLHLVISAPTPYLTTKSLANITCGLGAFESDYFLKLIDQENEKNQQLIQSSFDEFIKPQEKIDLIGGMYKTYKSKIQLLTILASSARMVSLGKFSSKGTPNIQLGHEYGMVWIRIKSKMPMGFNMEQAFEVVEHLKKLAPFFDELSVDLQNDLKLKFNPKVYNQVCAEQQKQLRVKKMIDYTTRVLYGLLIAWFVGQSLFWRNQMVQNDQQQRQWVQEEKIRLQEYKLENGIE